MNIDRLETTPGAGTALRFGGVVGWADPNASPALISFLAQSVRNLGPSPRGGRQIADHIAAVLVERDPEPAVGFAVIGPSDHGWATLLHGPVQVWDGSQWLYPPVHPGWIQAILTPRPAITVNARGAPTPALEPSSLLDLEAGVVPAGGFVLVPATARRQVSTAGSAPPFGQLTRPQPSPAGRDVPTSVIHAGPPTAVLEALTDGDQVEEGVGGEVDVAPVPAQPAPVPAAVPAPAVPAPAVPAPAVPAPAAPAPAPAPAAARPSRPGPPGSVDLQSIPVPPLRPLPPASARSPAVPGAPVVAGVMCPRGHFNRPGIPACVRCGSAIPSDTDTVSGSRPSLGSLIVDDGAIFRVDRPYLIGAQPERDPSVSGGLARPLALSGEDVSEVHAELRLHDWDVVLVDRRSAAGTSVLEPDDPTWVRVNAFEPRVLPPGTHVAFGQRIVTFIGPWAKPD